MMPDWYHWFGNGFRILPYPSSKASAKQYDLHVALRSGSDAGRKFIISSATIETRSHLISIYWVTTIWF